MKYLLSFLVIASLLSCEEQNVQSSLSRVSSKIKTDTFKITIEANDALQYSIDEIIVPENQLIQLTLKHTGVMPLSQMGHNWVLLKAGVEEEDFAMKARRSPETNYIPESEKEKIIVHTKTIGGGDQDVIVFEAPNAGTYTYCCTFPNHYAMMNGKLIVLEN